jgi:ATP-dependent Clp protease adaptor protein ClpS
MATKETDGEVETVERQRSKLKHPKQYKVYLLNDDYTTMDFVVSVLEGVFRKTPSEAVQIMLTVHKTGRGLCGVFSKQIAEAKTQTVHDRAKSAGYPLRCMMEEE